MLGCELSPSKPGVMNADQGRIQQRGVYIGDRSQFEDLSVEEYIADRDMMSTPRRELVYPEELSADLDKL